MMTARELLKDLINPPAAPQIPGLVFRGFRGESDYPNILTSINGSKAADGIERSDTLEDIVRNYSHLHNCDPYRDMIFVEIDGSVVGYGRVWWELNGDGEWLGFQLAFLLPAWRRKGIGRAMLRHNERRLRAISDQLLAEGAIPAATPRYFDGEIADTEVNKEALFKSEGYAPVRYAFSMVRDLSAPVVVTPLPAGLEVRLVPPDRYRTVWDAGQEAFRDHWSYVPEPEEEYQKWTKSAEFDPRLWQVAWDGDQVAGMVLNFVNARENAEYNRKRGYTEGISVRRPWRKRGLARALLTRSLQMFKEMGMTEAALGVDAQNLSGALNLYESVGFHVVKRHTVYRKGL
jgi:GNAT superfamily N-acetyltransferase